MALDGARIWIASRGGERPAQYQSSLVSLLEAAGAARVDVIGLEGIGRQTASDLGQWASAVVGSTVGRIASAIPGRSSEAPSEEQGPTGPDLVIADDPSILPAVRAALIFSKADPLVIGLVDDFKVDTRWRTNKVHALIAPHEEIRNGLAASVPVEIAGPPFNRQAVREPAETSRQEQKQSLGLESDPVVLIRADGMSKDTLERVVFQLTLLEAPAQCLFYFADSPELSQRLNSLAVDYGLPASMFGREDELDAVMPAVDLVLADATHALAIEMLLDGPPVMLVGPGKGIARAGFLADHGAVERVEDLLRLGSTVERALTSPNPESGAVCVSVEGNDDVVSAIGRLYSRAEELRSGSDSQGTSDSKEPSESGTKPRTFLQPIGSSVPKNPDAGQRFVPRISLAEAKSQMAEIILKEREVDRALADAVKQRDRWLERLELATDSGDHELVKAANTELDLLRAEVARQNRAAEELRGAKEKLKARVSAAAQHRRETSGKRVANAPQSPSGQAAFSDHEARFKRLELERDLKRLRRKIGDS
ncbi:MAG: hypothetical protein KC561_14010 [Myxococcales bacterium]|nr:hypothetical protein [Myxococcales bacterium]